MRPLRVLSLLLPLVAFGPGVAAAGDVLPVGGYWDRGYGHRHWAPPPPPPRHYGGYGRYHHWSPPPVRYTPPPPRHWGPRWGHDRRW